MSTNRQYPGIQRRRADVAQRVLSADLIARLAKLEPSGGSHFVPLLASWAAFFSRWTGQGDVVLRIQIAAYSRARMDRQEEEEENAAVLLIQLQEEPTVEQLLRQVGQLVAAACAVGREADEHEAVLEHPFRHGHLARRVLLGVGNVCPGLLVSTYPKGSALESNEASNQKPRGEGGYSLSLIQDEHGLTYSIASEGEAVDRPSIERMARCWEVLMEDMTNTARRPITHLKLIGSADRAEALHRFNNTAAAQLHHCLMHEAFEEQVESTPEAIAILHEEEVITYAELNRRANRLARHLSDRGTGPDQLVGLFLERGPQLVIGILGTLKAGGAYVPLDPAYPPERIEYMLHDAAPRVVLTQERLKERLPPAAAQIVALDSDWEEIAKHADANLDARALGVSPRNLAYVIYTSGSTGEPKGVAGEHRGMSNRIVAQANIDALSSNDICCHKTSIGFVDATFEILGPLSYGRPLVIASAAQAKDVERLASLIESRRITRLVTVPSLARSLLESASSVRCLQNLRSWTLSGEELKAELLRKLRERLPKCTFINLYGSTEVAADVTCHVIRPADASKVSIGQPIASTQTYILDSYLQPVPISAVGEIYVGGAALARGYLNRPELTAERFVSDPFGQDSRGRLYRTGDLARWRADGRIEYLGRSDRQVKIRGFRIEVTEIEARLEQHALVKEAVAVAREDDPEDKRLVVYVTARDERLTPEQLHVHLRAALPEYMVPSAVVILDRFPLTPSGKINRRALPAPTYGARLSQPYEPPQGEIEQALGRIWEQLLRVERVGRNDSFFELGGHSLLVIQMIEQLRRISLSTAAHDVFKSRTLADLACAVTRESPGRIEIPPNAIPAGCEMITPQMIALVNLDAGQIERIVASVPGGSRNVQDIYPLLPLQEGMLFLHLLNEAGADTYVRPLLFELASGRHLENFIAALQAVIDRHDVLRTALLWDQLTRPVQVVYRKAALPLEEIVLEQRRDPMAQLKERMGLRRQRLELRQAPLLRLQVASAPQGDRCYALLWTHHLLCDNGSLETMLSEVLAHMEGQAQTLPAPMPYRNHVAQALVHAHDGDAETFFRGKLGDVDEPTAPFSLLDVYADGSELAQARHALNPVLAQRIRTQAQRLAVTSATLFHAAWALVVARTSGRDDVVFGTVLIGRMHGSAGTQRILGMFINTLPLRLRLRDVTAVELVMQTQRELVELFDHEQTPLVVAQRCSAIHGNAPLFTALVNYQHDAVETGSLSAGAAGVKWMASQGATNYPVNLSVDDQNDAFVLDVTTDRRIDPNQVAQYMHAALSSLVKALGEAPRTSALELQVLPETQRQQLLRSFNATQTSYPREKLVHELFEEQAERTPEAIAAVCGAETLSYVQLNGRANQLARYLREKGVGPDQLVALFIERGLEMMVGLLGILKAGGAYVPLDPNYPTQRLAYVLEDAAPRMVLTQEPLRKRLSNTTIEVIALDSAWSEVERQSSANLHARTRPALHARHLAYVIYTSGSTGTPKGVMVEHGGLLNYVSWALRSYAPQDGDSIPIVTPLAFDATVTGLYCALLSGRSVALLPDGEELEGLEQLLRQQQQWSLIKISPAHLHALGQRLHSAKLPCNVGAFVIGGEALPPSTVELWHSIWPQIRLVNEYGPTETVVGCSVYDIPREWPLASSVPIGTPVGNTQMYILDRALQPVPVGVVGEIFIGGAGVARGYLNRPALTAGRFLPDPFSADAQARMYKSGDLGRWRADGNIEYLGRNDDQVKIRGFRIELGEIEVQLAGHPAVKEAVVVAREDVPGRKRLVAYVTQHPQISASAAQLRAHLQRVLPEYLIPSAFVVLDGLPLTSNGKLDRRALPVPGEGAYASREYEPPQGELEEALAAIWKDLLGIGRVGRQDNFFELGGHSLLAMQLVVRIRSLFAAHVPMRLPFECPTLELLSAKLRALGDGLPRTTIGSAGNNLEQLIEGVASMTESEVQELLRKLTTGATHD